MGYLGFGLGLVWIILLGYLVLSTVAPGNKTFYRLEFFVYSFLLGLVLVPTLLFFGNLLGIPLSLV